MAKKNDVEKDQIIMTVLCREIRGTMFVMIRFENTTTIKYHSMVLGAVDYPEANKTAICYGLLHINNTIKELPTPKAYEIKVLVHPKSYKKVAKKNATFQTYSRTLGHNITIEEFASTEYLHRLELHNYIASKTRSHVVDATQTSMPF